MTSRQDNNMNKHTFVNMYTFHTFRVAVCVGRVSAGEVYFRCRV